MDYIPRERLSGLNTADMLAALIPDERTRVLHLAPLIADAWSRVNLKHRPTLSTIAVANLVQGLKMGSLDFVPFLYSGDFALALHEVLSEAGLNNMRDITMKAFYRTNDLMTEEAFEAIYDAAEEARKKEPLFDFSILENYSANHE